MASSTRQAIACILVVLAIVIVARSQSGPEKRPGATFNGKVTISKEGKIGLYNLAPGRYWILALQASDSAQAPFTKMKLPDGTETRAQLRREAEAAKMEIELKPCQRVVDFRFSHR